MNTQNTPQQDNRAGLECRCGKEFRPISQNTLVYRCLICGALRAYAPVKVAA